MNYDFKFCYCFKVIYIYSELLSFFMFRPSPYAPRMYPGMPPPFQHRPPFGMPMGPYGGPARPPFMSPMGQRPGGMTRIPTTAATSKEDQLQQMGTATLEQVCIVYY